MITFRSPVIMFKCSYMIRHRFILLKRESEVGKMGQEVEAYFEELVEKFLSVH